jgi:hypothetical protein
MAAMHEEQTANGEEGPDPVPDDQREERHTSTGVPDARCLDEAQAKQQYIEQQRAGAAADISVRR